MDGKKFKCNDGLLKLSPLDKEQLPTPGAERRNAQGAAGGDGASGTMGEHHS